MTSLAIHQQPEYLLIQKKGSNTGTKYRITSERITIGRSRSNDIVLEDAKCSREHIEIAFSNQGPYVRNLSDNNPLFVNGKEMESSLLLPDTTIQIGETLLEFKVLLENQALTPAALQKTTAGLSPLGSGQTSFSSDAPQSHQPSPQKDNGKKRFYIILGIIGLVFLWLMTSSNSKKPEEPGLITEAELKVNIEKTAEELKIEQENLLKTGKLSPAFRAAQKSYIIGFRDYEKGQYNRALESFQACLSLYPSHKLCNRYLNLAKRKTLELAQYYMIKGRKHMDANQFSKCESSFKNVLYLIKINTHSLYKEAHTNLNYCRLQMKGRY